MKRINCIAVPLLDYSIEMNILFENIDAAQNAGAFVDIRYASECK